MRTTFILSATLFTFSCNHTTEKHPTIVEKSKHNHEILRTQLTSIVQDKKAEIGIAVIGPEGDTLSIRGDQHFPMMSVAKFPQALTLMHLVDEGKMMRDEKLHITEHDLQQRTFSTLQKDHPQKEFDLTIDETFAYSIGQSDNITSNVIFNRVGGPAVVDAFMKESGITDIGVGVDYWHLSEDINKNWSTPKAMALLLQKFHSHQVVSENSQAMIWKTLVESTAGPNRIKGLLPAGTVVGHKTGTGSRNETTSMTEAFNDVGIVELGDGKHFCIVVFIKNSMESEEVNAEIIAKVSRMVYEFYQGGNKSS